MVEEERDKEKTTYIDRQQEGEICSGGVRLFEICGGCCCSSTGYGEPVPEKTKTKRRLVLRKEPAVFRNIPVHRFWSKPAGLKVFQRFNSLCGLIREPDRLRPRVTVEPVRPAGPVRF